MHSDAQFMAPPPCPAHVEMIGFLGMGNNPIVGATVAVAVQLLRKPEVRKSFQNAAKAIFRKEQSTRFHKEAGALRLSTFCQPLLKVSTKMMQWAMSLFECVFYMRTQIAACCEDIQM